MAVGVSIRDGAGATNRAGLNGHGRQWPATEDELLSFAESSGAERFDRLGQGVPVLYPARTSKLRGPAPFVCREEGKRVHQDNAARRGRIPPLKWTIKDVHSPNVPSCI
jgi:hypothetical protein